MRVTATGLNPMDCYFISMPEMAESFGITVPSGFAHDFAGVIDEAGAGVSDFGVGDRVFGGLLNRAAADYIVADPTAAGLYYTPDAISDEIAAVLPVAEMTATAALEAINLVGVFAVQLARIVGARVIGTASESSHEFVRGLGAEPVAYGPGLADRVRAIAPDGVSAATALVGTETVDATLDLGVSAKRISTIAAGPDRYRGTRPTGGINASAGALDHVVESIVAGRLTIPIAQRFSLDQIQDAARLQSSGHVHGKLVVTL